MKKSDKPIIIEIESKASISTIWEALTQLSLMRQWLFPEIPDFDPVVGFCTKFDIKTDNRVFKHVWKVKEVEPKSKITVEWSYEGYAGRGDVIYQIIDRPDKARLFRLTNTVLEDFDDSIPEFKRQSAEAGWNYLIRHRLNAVLI